MIEQNREKGRKRNIIQVQMKIQFNNTKLIRYNNGYCNLELIDENLILAKHRGTID